MIAARTSLLPLARSDSSADASSEPPLIAKMRAMKAGIWRSWTTLLR